MKNAPTTISNESALDKCDYTVGTRPARTNTVTACVLARLLEGNSLTGMESVFKQSTTRLAAFVNRLGSRYGWVIESTSLVAGTNDGRIAHISSYWLPKAVIASSYDDGARDWINKVNKALAERKNNAASCKSKAAKINASRLPDPRQCNLWEGK
jgi:hypothetical protein